MDDALDKSLEYGIPQIVQALLAAGPKEILFLQHE